MLLLLLLGSGLPLISPACFLTRIRTPADGAGCRKLVWICYVSGCHGCSFPVLWHGPGWMIPGQPGTENIPTGGIFCMPASTSTVFFLSPFCLHYGIIFLYQRTGGRRFQLFSWLPLPAFRRARSDGLTIQPPLAPLQVSCAPASSFIQCRPAHALSCVFLHIVFLIAPFPCSFHCFS